MKKQVQKLTVLSLLAFVIVTSAFGQNSISLSFTGINNASYFQLGSITVQNHTQGGDTTLYYPDTVLVLNFVGVTDPPGHEDGFKLDQNFPNPVTDRTTIGIYLPDKGILNLAVSDILGRRLITSSRMLSKGDHSFVFVPPSGGIYMLTARWKETSQSIKILSQVSGRGDACLLEYNGSIQDQPMLKRNRSDWWFPFNPGDLLLFIGNAEPLQSGMWDTPEISQEYVFQFATNIPCPGLDSVFYEERWYHTIQIFSQCWMKENLNVGTMIPGSQEQTDNGILEKYCYANGEVACNARGGLYIWEEMMQYVTEEGARGICPPGWHSPTDLEYKILEGAADSQFSIGSPIWNQSNFRGYDVSRNLKAVAGWFGNGNGTDAYGFTALPSGYWYQNEFFEYTAETGWWTSSFNASYLPYYRGMSYGTDAMARMVNTFGTFAIPVRCLKD